MKKGGKCLNLQAREESSLMGKNYFSTFSGFMAGYAFSSAFMCRSRIVTLFWDWGAEKLLQKSHANNFIMDENIMERERIFSCQHSEWRKRK